MLSWQVQQHWVGINIKSLTEDATHWCIPLDSLPSVSSSGGTAASQQGSQCLVRIMLRFTSVVDRQHRGLYRVCTEGALCVTVPYDAVMSRVWKLRLLDSPKSATCRVTLYI